MSRAVPDLFFPIRPEPDFQIDCNFTNLTCKTLRTYKWFKFLIIFLCCSNRHDFLNFWISYLFKSTSLSYYSSKLSTVWEKSTFQIRQNYPAPVGFLPEPDFCRIWKKCRIPAAAEIQYIPTYEKGDQLLIWKLSIASQSWCLTTHILIYRETERKICYGNSAVLSNATKTNLQPSNDNSVSINGTKYFLK